MAGRVHDVDVALHGVEGRILLALQAAPTMTGDDRRLVMTASLERPNTAERIKFAKSCGKIARHMFL